MHWTPEEDRANARSILRDTIQRESRRELTDTALERAVDVAEKVWVGTTACGTAAKAGLAAVEAGIYK